MNTDAKVGLFVVVSAALLLATIYHITNAQIRGARVSYKTYLRYAGGLESGTDVLFGGIKVGMVTAVRPDAADPTRIEIAMDVKEGTPINASSVAKLGSVTVVTSPVISISTGSNEAPRLPPGGVIPSAETISLDDTERKVVGLADSARTMLDSVHKDVDGLTGEARQLLANVNEITGPANRRRINGVLTNADALVADLKPKVDEIADQVAKLTRDANGLLARVAPVVDNANAAVAGANETIAGFNQPLQTDLAELKKTLEEARNLIATLNAAAKVKDEDVNETIENVRMVTDNLNELTESLKQRPWSLIRIRQPKDRKVPQ